jgi:hypothetical protein
LALQADGQPLRQRGVHRSEAEARMTLVVIGVLYITFRPPWVGTYSRFTHFGEHVLGLDRREREYLLFSSKGLHPVRFPRDFIPPRQTLLCSILLIYDPIKDGSKCYPTSGNRVGLDRREIILNCLHLPSRGTVLSHSPQEYEGPYGFRLLTDGP